MSAPRFLVDENLSVLLPGGRPCARKYQATHINQFTVLRKAKDWDILKVVEEEDSVLVAKNAFEFRGRFERLEIHPGVVFLLSVVPRDSKLTLRSGY